MSFAYDPETRADGNHIRCSELVLSLPIVYVCCMSYIVCSLLPVVWCLLSTAFCLSLALLIYYLVVSRCSALPPPTARCFPPGAKVRLLPTRCVISLVNTPRALIGKYPTCYHSTAPRDLIGQETRRVIWLVNSLRGLMLPKKHAALLVNTPRNISNHSLVNKHAAWYSWSTNKPRRLIGQQEARNAAAKGEGRGNVAGSMKAAKASANK